MKNGDDWIGRVEAAVGPVLASHGLELVDSKWQREGRRWVLRFFVDKPGGVTVADCQALSREAGDVLDASALIEPAYDLEVSSPGLDRTLESVREYAWAVGKDVRCWVREPVEGRRELTGRLLAATPTGLTLGEPDGRTVDVPRVLVTKARLDIAFGRPPRPGRK